jgi:antitoxin component of MazEF toxin-antitoxin module
VTLSVSTDLLRLSPADRKFVFELIDQLASYEAQPEPEAA